MFDSINKSFLYDLLCWFDLLNFEIISQVAVEYIVYIVWENKLHSIDPSIVFYWRNRGNYRMVFWKFYIKGELNFQSFKNKIWHLLLLILRILFIIINALTSICDSLFQQLRIQLIFINHRLITTKAAIPQVSYFRKYDVDNSLNSLKKLNRRIVLYCRWPEGQ